VAHMSEAAHDSALAELKMSSPKANQQGLIEAMSDASISTQVKEILSVKLEDAKREVEHNKRMRQLQELKLQMELRALFNNITGTSRGPPLQLGNQRAQRANESTATVEQLPSRPPSPSARKQAEAVQAGGVDSTAQLSLLQDLPSWKPLDEALKSKKSTDTDTRPPVANAADNSSSSSSGASAQVTADEQAQAQPMDSEMFEVCNEDIADEPAKPQAAAAAAAAATAPVEAPGLVLLSEHSEIAGSSDSEATVPVPPTAPTMVAVTLPVTRSAAAAAVVAVADAVEQQVVTIQDVEVAVACTDTVDSIVERVALLAEAHAATTAADTAATTDTTANAEVSDALAAATTNDVAVVQVQDEAVYKECTEAMEDIVAAVIMNAAAQATAAAEPPPLFEEASILYTLSLISIQEILLSLAGGFE
jgi:hypothetical protein